MTIEAYVLELGQEPQSSHLEHDPVYKAQDADLQLSTTLHGYGHLHEYTRDEIISICCGVGFTVVKAEMLNKSVAHFWRRPFRPTLAARLIYSSIVAIVLGFRPLIFIECEKRLGEVQ